MAEYAKRAKRPCFIDTLPDPILAKIFAYLPHAERLHVSEVCSRWHTVTRLEWLDVVDLDLTQIPSASIGAILRLSPNVESIIGLRCFLIMNDLCEQYQTNLTSLKLYDLRMGFAPVTGDEKHTNEQYHQLIPVDVKGTPRYVFRDWSESALQSLNVCTTKLNKYFEKFPQIEELVLHNLSVTDLKQVAVTSIIPFSLQSQRQLNTLVRLQLSGSGRRDMYSARLLSESLRTLQQLENLILRFRLIVERGDDNANRNFCDAVPSLQNLRELSLDVRFDVVNRQGYLEQRFWTPGRAITAEIALNLPKLEVLFLIRQGCARETFVTLFTKHPSLRVLMFADAKRAPTYLQCVRMLTEFYILEKSQFWGSGLPRLFLGGHVITEMTTIADRCPIFSSAKFLVPERKINLSESSQPLPFLHVFLDTRTHDYFLQLTPTAVAKVTLFDIDEPIPRFLKSDEVAEVLDGVWVAAMIQETASYDSNLWN